MEYDPLVAEALAVRWALSIAVDFKLYSVVLFSDALTVVDCINQVEQVAILDPIALDCVNLFQSFSVYLSILH